jgi:hypothetical protein
MKGDKIFNQALTLWHEEPDVQAEGAKTLGRSPELIAERNEHIMYRYYYYQKFTDKRWDVVVKLLRRQFYISETTITEIIMDNSARLKQIQNEQLTIRQLKERYEFF